MARSRGKPTTYEQPVRERAGFAATIAAVVLAVCGLASTDAAASTAGQSATEICRGALASDLRSWSGEPQAAEHVEVAQRRRYSVEWCANLVVCQGAVSPTSFDWDQRPAAQASVQQARQRGLTVLSCRAMIGTAERGGSAPGDRAAASAGATGTNNRMEPGSAPPAPAAPQPDRMVMAIQELLTGLGYDAGPADGVLGPRTIAAIAAFQRDSGETVDGRPSEALRGKLQAAVAAEKQPGGRVRLASTGSGFFVTGNIAVTNFHVVKQCRHLTLWRRGVMLGEAKVAGSNELDDLALIKASFENEHRIAVRSQRQPRAAEQVVVFGFPLNSLLSPYGNTTVGHVTALTGMLNDSRQLQISAPIHQGNSGGPVLDASGHAIGVVVSSMNTVATVRHTGTIPQNLNFAVKSSVLALLLSLQKVEYVEASAEEAPLPTTEIAERAERASVQIACYR